MSPADIALEAAQALATARGWTPIESLSAWGQITENGEARYLCVAKVDDEKIALECDEFPDDARARRIGEHLAGAFAIRRGEAPPPPWEGGAS